MKKSSDSENNKDNKSSNSFEITADGSLGLLALGAAGIKAWRKKRDELLKPAYRLPAGQAGTGRKKKNTENE